MKHSSIYTKQGDGGTSRLFRGGKKSTAMPKNDAIFDAIGTVDMLNSTIGLVLAETLPKEVRDILTQVQHHLFALGAQLAGSSVTVTQKKISTLETHIDTIDAALPLLSQFILPQGSRASAQLHFARTVCRQMERSIVNTTATYAIADTVFAYANRLSDLLFVLARHCNTEKEVTWQR